MTWGMGVRMWLDFPRTPLSVSVSVCVFLSFCLDTFKGCLDNRRNNMKSSTLETLRIMAGVERRLNRLMRLETIACGHEEEVAKAERCRDGLMEYIEREVEALVRKAGVK